LVPDVSLRTPGKIKETWVNVNETKQNYLFGFNYIYIYTLDMRFIYKAVITAKC